MSRLVLAAPTAFKGSFGPRQVADAIVAGVRLALPDATVLQCPISDGGDGLLDAVLPLDALRERVSVTGPLGSKVEGLLGWLDSDTAIFESATACGLALLRADQLDPLRATTRGVGEMVWEAVDRGARTVVVGLGGSATVDGGSGTARGLGWTLRDASGARLAAQVVALADVTTPLTGPQGAAPVFGPQKGATPDGVQRLAAGLDALAAHFGRLGRPDLATLPGGGAAGGLGAGLAFFAKAQLTRGADWVLDRVGFDAALAKADLLITGEGSFDRTSLVGKASGEVVRRAQAARTKVAVVAGTVNDLIGVHAVGGDGRMLDAA